MEPLKTGVLLVDRDFHAFTRRIAVKTAANADIMDLKEKAKEMMPELSSYLLTHLSVWKMKGDMIIKNLTPPQLSEILGKIDVNDKNTIRSLDDEEKVADIGLSFGETLLLQVPAVVMTDDSPVGAAITRDVAPEYKHCFLIANSEKGFTIEDIETNGIRGSEDTPGFVADHECILSQKRKLTPEMRVLAEGMIDKGLVADYFCSTEESSESNPIANLPEVNLPELQHLAYLSLVNAKSWRTLSTRFKESDAYWLLFSAISNYYENYYEVAVPSTIAIKHFEPWLFSLLIKVNNRLHTYRPKNDFLLLKHGLPRLAVEVNSTQIEPPVDLIRPMLQGASIVRFANTNLDAYKKEKNFVFVAIYIDNSGKADRYLLHQYATGTGVFRKKQTFDLANANERMRFALELYNISSTWHDDEHTADQVKKLHCTVNEAAKQLPAYTGGKRDHDETGGPQPKKPRTGPFGGGAAGGADGAARGAADGAARGAAGRLEDSGYEVVPDAFETDGDAWELINKPPPHVRIVYRRSDPNKTECIAKHLREGSNEVAIHEYLQSRPSPYIISFIEAVPSTTREWLILPMLYSIADQWFLDDNGAARRVQLGWGLIKGLAHLHEYKIAHRDIKPDNLVCDDDFTLKIIDFDIAIKVEDENMEIEGYWGTEGWAAPEIGVQDDGPTGMYSPIKADRWSCGRVILRHIMVGGTVMSADRRLLKFANQLMAKDPQQRPSLPKLLASPPISVAYRQPMEESVKPPDAKKRRLEPEFVQPRPLASPLMGVISS